MQSIRQCFATTTLLALCACTATGQTVVFQENFDQLDLRPPVDEDIFFPEAFTHVVPESPFGPNNPWRRNASDVPQGVFEWEGWSFANKDFWLQIADDEPEDVRREEFTRGSNTIVVADPNEWNDQGDPANEVAFYNTFLTTPEFDVPALLQLGSDLRFRFDSSWLPQCCDDGEAFALNQNNKTATVRARVVSAGGVVSFVEVLRWESAPSFDVFGNPLPDMSGTPNPFFKDDATNELLFLDLAPLLTSNNLRFSLEFGLTNAGDDWWWAMDNMQMISLSLSTVLGDMDLSGVVDVDDIDDFAQAMHSTADYVATHFGEFPATRGSLDSVFDFDDIDWFVNLLNGKGIAASRATIIAAIEAQAVPEPTTVCLAAIFLGVALTRRQRL